MENTSYSYSQLTINASVLDLYVDRGAAHARTPAGYAHAPRRDPQFHSVDRLRLVRFAELARRKPLKHEILNRGERDARG